MAIKRTRRRADPTDFLFLFDKKSDSINQSVALALGMFRHKNTRAILLNFLTSNDDDTKEYAADSLLKLYGQEIENAKEMIFDKFNMLHSSTDKTKVADILVEGLNERGKPTPNWTLGALIGAGGIYSTVEDLSKFAIAQLDSSNKALALTRIKTYKETDTRDVGFLFLNENFRTK